MPFDLIPVDPVQVAGQYLEPLVNPLSPWDRDADPPNLNPPERGSDYFKYPAWWRPDDRIEDFTIPERTRQLFQLYAFGGIPSGQFSTRTTVCHRLDCYFFGPTDVHRRALDRRVLMALDRRGSWGVSGIRLPRLLTEPDLSYGDEGVMDADGTLLLDMTRSYAATIFSVTWGLEMDVRPFSRVTQASEPISVASIARSRVTLRSYMVDFGRYFCLEP